MVFSSSGGGASPRALSRGAHGLECTDCFVEGVLGLGAPFGRAGSHDFDGFGGFLQLVAVVRDLGEACSRLLRDLGELLMQSDYKLPLRGFFFQFFL